MFSWFKHRRLRQRTADHIYGAVVAQARQPRFFNHLGIPDTLEGRYEMVLVHLFLILDRLRNEGPTAQAISRKLNERFVTDMDDCMRELGVGDITVPKRVKLAAAGLYDRVLEYQSAISEPASNALTNIIQSRVLTPEYSEPLSPAASAIADYMHNCRTALADQPLQDIITGNANFADVALIASDSADP